MAKGAIAKQEVTNKILEMFSNAFLYDKEIRIPMIEDGAEVQIKVTLTCAKVNVSNDNNTSMLESSAKTNVSNDNLLITEEEKKETINLIEKLGL